MLIGWNNIPTTPKTERQQLVECAMATGLMAIARGKIPVDRMITLTYSKYSQPKTIRLYIRAEKRRNRRTAASSAMPDRRNDNVGNAMLSQPMHRH